MHLYSDLNVNSAAGRAEMLARVECAAAKLCRDRADPRLYATATLAEPCASPQPRGCGLPWRSTTRSVSPAADHWRGSAPLPPHAAAALRRLAPYAGWR